ncbi:MAG: hypothetical protein ACO326_08245 [Burkholderiaceae bacterium]
MAGSKKQERKASGQLAAKPAGGSAQVSQGSPPPAEGGGSPAGGSAHGSQGSPTGPDGGGSGEGNAGAGIAGANVSGGEGTSGDGASGGEGTSAVGSAAGAPGGISSELRELIANQSKLMALFANKSAPSAPATAQGATEGAGNAGQPATPETPKPKPPPSLCTPNGKTITWSPGLKKALMVLKKLSADAKAAAEKYESLKTAMPKVIQLIEDGDSDLAEFKLKKFWESSEVLEETIEEPVEAALVECFKTNQEFGAAFCHVEEETEDDDVADDEEATSSKEEINDPTYEPSSGPKSKKRRTGRAPSVKQEEPDCDLASCKPHAGCVDMQSLSTPHTNTAKNEMKELMKGSGIAHHAWPVPFMAGVKVNINTMGASWLTKKLIEHEGQFEKLQGKNTKVYGALKHLAGWQLARSVNNSPN